MDAVIHHASQRVTHLLRASELGSAQAIPRAYVRQSTLFIDLFSHRGLLEESAK